MNPMLVLDVVLFELRRSLTPARMAIWFVLVAFPIALMTVLRITVPVNRLEPWGLTLYFLVPEVLCLLGLLLWATPVISTEIEGQTWIYLAMRRSGRSLVLFGKYVTAVLWSLSAALVATTLCIVVMGPAGGLRLWAVIGTLFFRRTMVTAVFYTMAIEYGLSLVPAVANKMTINYRLRGLLAQWMDWEGARSAAENVFGTEPASTHLLALGILSVLFLSVATIRLVTSQLPMQQEG
jgi:ABC-type transport system involved in multi-copper enzyme maturation permease subunit